jgi:hypothetical protein
VSESVFTSLHPEDESGIGNFETDFREISLSLSKTSDMSSMKRTTMTLTINPFLMRQATTHPVMACAQLMLMTGPVCDAGALQLVGPE